MCNDLVKEYVFDLNDKEIVAICLSSHSMLTFAVHIFFGKLKFQPDFIVYTAYKM